MNIKEWLEKSEHSVLGGGIQKISDLGPGALLLILAVSLASSFFASWLYSRFYGGRATGSQIHRAFPLLGISITAIFICVQFSLALSLGLLGALSIIRFRTPIKEPEEVAFLMLVIATSISCATFNFLFMISIYVVAAAGLALVNYGPQFWQPRAGHGSLVIRLSEPLFYQHREELFRRIERVLPKGRIDSVAVEPMGCLITYIFPNLTPEAFGGIEHEIKTLIPESAINVFYSRAESFI